MGLIHSLGRLRRHEDQMKRAAKCVDTVEKLASVPQLSGRREAQFRDGKRPTPAKEVLDYKKDKKLCK